MTDVLLINAPVRNPDIDPHARASPPLGLAYIAAVLEGDGYAVHAVDMNILGLPEPCAIEDFLIDSAPSLLGVSSTTEAFPNALEIARRARAACTETFVVLGGPHVTALPFDAFDEPAIDAVVLREGEATMRELTAFVCRGKGELQSIKGLVFRDRGKVRQTESRRLLDDLDTLPFPERRFFPMGEYTYPATISGARGCPGKCIFCAGHTITGSRYRVRSPENVVSEIRHLVSKDQISNITFVDDTFTVLPERVKEICALIRSHRLDIGWGCSTRVDMVSREMLKSMAEAGCREIHFGVESASDPILMQIRKDIRREQVERSVEAAKSVGIKVYCSFMLPHPGDTPEAISETMFFIKALLKEDVGVSVSITTPFPGTELWKNPERFGIRILSTDWFDFDCCTPVMETKHLRAPDIRRIITDLSFKGISNML
ncbi:B12-binding domain-containing radical SAM protein [Thermodesulfobacteriota bacterium]